MKRSLSFLSFMMVFVFASMAQVCTPDSSQFTSGVFVYPASLPCIMPGTAYSGTVSMKVPDSLDAHLFYSAIPANTYYMHVDSIAIDSITGFPAGVSATSNPTMGSWMHGGAYGCALFAGTTSAAAGTYPLTIAGRACAHGTVPIVGAIDTCASWTFSDQYPYSVTVCTPPPPPACTPDSTHFTAGHFVYPDSLPCIQNGQAISEVISIHVPDSVDVHNFYSALPAGFYYVYIDSLRLDSITGMPAGISAATNPAFGSGAWIHGGGFGCGLFTGTTTAPGGTYPLNIYGRGCIHGNVLGLNIDSCQSGNLGSYISYSLKVCFGVGVLEINTGAVGLNIYPNPNQGAFTVTVSSAEHTSGQMSVLDQLGRSIHTQEIDVTGTKQIPIELGNISAGVYVLMVNTANGKTVREFVVK